MAINYAEKYSPIVDEIFTHESFTNALINNNFDWVGVETVKVYSIPTVEMNDYTPSGNNRYGTPTELENEVQELTLKKDRSFTFTIDRKSYDDTLMTMEAGARLRRQIIERVLPEIDTYRLSALVSNALTDNIKEATITKENAYEMFLGIQELLDDANVPMAGRICVCRPSFHNKLKLDDSFTKLSDMATQIAIKGAVGEVDGVPVIKVPSSYFPTNVEFIITHPVAMTSPIKLNDYRIHVDPPGINGWLVEGRVRYDAFVLTNKKSAIGVCKAPSGEN